MLECPLWVNVLIKNFRPNLAMRTKPIVLYSFCALGNLAVAPGDSQRRARPERANLASEEAGAQTSPKRWRPPRAFRRSPARQLPHLGYLQLLYRRGFATVATPVVAPTLTALAHHAHAPTTPTSTQAATCDRHPLSEGSRPSTGMQGYL